MHVVKMYNIIKVLFLIELIEVVVQIHMYNRILKIYKTNNSYSIISNKSQIPFHLQWLKIFTQLQIYILHNKINNPFLSLQLISNLNYKIRNKRNK